MKKTLMAGVLGCGILSGAGAKDLVVYFSVTDNTKKLAEEIQKHTDADIKRIIPVSEYPKRDYRHTELTDRAMAERDSDARPEFQDLDLDLDAYDTVFIGYPIWWYTMPMIMHTFFDKYDFSNTKIAPFNTHAGSGSSGTYEKIKALEPDAIVVDGLAIGAGTTDEEREMAVKTWLEGTVK